jgi:hypothetical protein
MDAASCETDTLAEAARPFVPPPPPPPRPLSPFAGLLSRKELAAAWPGGPVHERTLIRMENLASNPLPVLKIQKRRLYDLTAVRAWLLGRQEPLRDEVPRLGRPAGKRAK